MIATLVTACLLLAAFAPLAMTASRKRTARRYDSAFLDARTGQRQG